MSAETAGHAAEGWALPSMLRVAGAHGTAAQLEAGNRPANAMYDARRKPEFFIESPCAGLQPWYSVELRFHGVVIWQQL
jgi:hypothetical protein